jgi:SnoaL-like domain
MTTTQTLPSDALPTADSISQWVNDYLHAWETNASTDITALFTEDAEYSESPYETEWIGRDDIVDGWRGRWDWQQGGWTFEWSIRSIDGATVVLTGIGHYKELGDFDNVWTVTFDGTGRCSRFVMVNTARD